MQKTWKDFLLRSSLPLEYSVTETLRKLGVISPSEYKYEKPNEQGVVTTFSIDVHGTTIKNEEKLGIELFVECKYRHQGTKWVFTPKSFESLRFTDFKDTFISLDALCQSWKIDNKLINSFSENYDLCGKGIELYNDGANPKSITQAVSQLQYSLVKKVAEAMEDQFDEVLGNPDQIHIFVPIIVTTAELWRLNVGTTIEDIHEAKDLCEVASETDFLLIHEPPDNDLNRYTNKYLMDFFGEDEKVAMTEALRKNNAGVFSFNTYVRRFARTYPSIFAVIKYDSLDKRLGNMLNFFNRRDILNQRKIGK